MREEDARMQETSKENRNMGDLLMNKMQRRCNKVRNNWSGGTGKDV